MDLRTMKRLALIVMALFPALWGLIGDANNVADFSSTANNAVRPVLAMTNTYGNPWQTWRAITGPWGAPAALVIIMTFETATGVFGAISVVVMLANLRARTEAFARGKAWMILACLCASLIWGVGFLIVAGDWFLTWQEKPDSLGTQLGAMIYFLPCALALIVAMVHRDDG